MLGFIKTNITKLSFDSPQFRKKVYLSSILLFSIFVASTFFIHTAFAAGSEGCGYWDIRLECDLSGWMKLFLGDVGVGAMLAIFLHVIAHRSNVKLDANASEIQKIIVSQETIRKARRDYAVQNLKNHLTTLIFVIGIINRLTINYNSTTEPKSILYTKIKLEEERMVRILQNARNTIVYSSDTLDPSLVNQLDGVCTFVGQSSVQEKDGLLEFQKYERSKRKIDESIKKLADITESSPVFK